MAEVLVLMAPNAQMLAAAGWWRNRHNDRTVWRERVARAAQDVAPGFYTARIACDYGTRGKPPATDRVRAAIALETAEALALCGVGAEVTDVQVTQSGRGQGETRLYLERA